MANSYTDLIKLRKPAAGDTGWDDEVNDNAQITEVILAAVMNNNYVISGFVPSDGGGLQVDYTAGVCIVNGTKRTIGASNKACAASDLNWLYVDNAGAMQINTTPPTGNYAPIALIDTAGAAIDRIGDLRQIQGSLLGFQGAQFAADAEANDTYVITLSPVPTGYFTGMVVVFTANTANTGAATLNVNALGAKTIKKNHDKDLETGDIEAGQVVIVIYDGTNFQMISAPGNFTTIDLTGGQIAFPATAVPSADPNTLDDYEEGTWTMGVSFGGGVTGITYSRTAGYYTKIGNMCFVQGYCSLTSKGTDNGVAVITELPFTLVNNDAGQTAVTLRLSDIVFTEQYQAYVPKNTTHVVIGSNANGASETQLTDAEFKNNSTFRVGLSYRIE